MTPIHLFAPKKTNTLSLRGFILLLLFLIASFSLVIYYTSKTHIPVFRPSECDDTTQDFRSLFERDLKNATNQLYPDYWEEDLDDPLATNISHIVFEIGGSVATWKDRMHYIESWWKKNMTRGFVWLDQRPDKWPESSPPYKVSEECSFKYTSFVSAVRIARIVVEAFRDGLPNVRWFVMGDDDTVFFTQNLVSVLSRFVFVYGNHGSHIIFLVEE